MKQILCFLIAGMLLCAPAWAADMGDASGDASSSVVEPIEPDSPESQPDEPIEQEPIIPDSSEEQLPPADIVEELKPPSNDSESEQPNSSEEVTLSIDDRNIYDGMERPYRKGYSPMIEKNRLILVLPLVADGALKRGRLTAALNLGEPEDSPFLYRNYQKTFKLSEQTINNTENTRMIYYVRFDLALSKERYNGVYPVKYIISARDMLGKKVAQEFTTYVMITDGQLRHHEEEMIAPNPPTEEDDLTEPDDTNDNSDNSGENDDWSGGASDSGGFNDFPNNDSGVLPDSGNSGGGEEKPESSPVVIISGCTTQPEKIFAGEEFTVNVTLLNTSKKQSVQNMLVTLNCGENLSITDASNTIYVDKLGKSDTTTLSLHCKTALDTPADTYPIELSMSYDDMEAQTLTASGTVRVTIAQAQRLELKLPSISKTVTAGDTIPLSFQVMNLGRSKACNVRCEVTGAGLIPTSTAFVGDMEPGTDGTAELNLFIGTKDLSEGYTGTEQYGSTTGTVTLIYEDEVGKESREEFTFDTVIQEPTILTSPKEEEVAKPASQWWTSIFIVGGILLFGIVGLVIIKWRKQREMA